MKNSKRPSVEILEGYIKQLQEGTLTRSEIAERHGVTPQTTWRWIPNATSYHRVKEFNVARWNKWLDRLNNEGPDPKLAQGIAEFREKLRNG